MRHRRPYFGFLVFVLALAALASALYVLALPGLSVARREPSRLETSIATWLLHQSVPDSAKQSVNPLAMDNSSAAAGQILFSEKLRILPRV